ncbi:Gfo/Idh/MocA family protein [Paenibacillus eucommiae]|uniref:Dehydrogenase n=1 Tax=Paenibacillus eucommiae TaxID=1355755 RepID=A0ABS4ITA0_9BACL|nr:Gfo/Idh/MocA family oxidoreductase [Paenibacillus eucommiae]MBP1990799.1 putative dehydrogenase [Paenibacillus eucommiae]
MIQNKVLQIGSGSMGTRRMRDLSARGDVEIALFDEREDRRERAAERFGVTCFSSLESALLWGPDTVVISTPPHMHAEYVEMALLHGLHFFCEAEIWPYNYLEVERIGKERNIVAAPSCTLYFLPVVRELKKIVEEQLGGLHAYYMCLSVDAPGWHPGEGEEYYARHRSTAPGREMVPFELIALDYVFGEPEAAAGTVRQRGELLMKSEDTWCLQMTLASGATGQLSVFMGSPQTMRKGIAGGTNGFIEFDLSAGTISRKLPKLGIDDMLHLGAMSDILESVYADEINMFIEAVRKKTDWPFTYRKSSIVTGTLAAAEKSAITGRVELVDPGFLPATLPDQY